VRSQPFSGASWNGIQACEQIPYSTVARRTVGLIALPRLARPQTRGARHLTTRGCSHCDREGQAPMAAPSEAGTLAQTRVGYAKAT
jgi:hypothetical protein